MMPESLFRVVWLQSDPIVAVNQPPSSPAPVTSTGTTTATTGIINFFQWSKKGPVTRSQYNVTRAFRVVAHFWKRCFTIFRITRFVFHSTEQEPQPTENYKLQLQ